MVRRTKLAMSRRCSGDQLRKELVANWSCGPSLQNQSRRRQRILREVRHIDVHEHVARSALGGTGNIQHVSSWSQREMAGKIRLGRCSVLRRDGHRLTERTVRL